MRCSGQSRLRWCWRCGRWRDSIKNIFEEVGWIDARVYRARLARSPASACSGVAMNGTAKMWVDTLVAAGRWRDSPFLPVRRHSLILIPVVSGLILLVLWSTVLGLIRNERKA